MHTVLIVDDEPEIRRLTRRRLQAAGYQVVDAGDGEQGIEAVKQHNPDLILCDITMPGMDGIEFLTTIRGNFAQFADIPFIFITGLRGRDDLLKGLSLGADDYLAKPVDPAILLTKIRSMLNRISRTEQRMKAEMEVLRTSVLSALPHELRTPLTHIIGFSEILKNEIHGPINNGRYSEYVHDIYAGGQQLLGIVNGSLDLIEVLCGKTAPAMEAVDVGEFVDHCVSEFKEQSDRAGLVLSVHGHYDVPHMVTDPVLLKRAVGALLSNAVKFTSPGGRIDLSAALDDEEKIRLSITDTGAGMMPEKIERLFDAFEQTDSGDARRYGGAGIGLTMVRAIINILNANVSMESQPGVGTTVTLSVAARAAGNNRAPAAKMAQTA